MMSKNESIFERAFDAVANGELDTVRSLLAAQAELAADDRLLEESAGYNRVEMVQLLLDAGASVQGTGEHYLVYAVAHGACDAADLLIRHGATASAFWVAAGVGFSEVVDGFFDENDQLKPSAWTGRRNWEDFGMPDRPLPQDARAVAVEGLIAAAMNNRTAVLDALLARGVPISGEATIGTPLHWAAYWNKPKMIKHLVEAGANASFRDDEWNATPLGWAKENESAEAIAQFAQLGVTDC